MQLTLRRISALWAQAIVILGLASSYPVFAADHPGITHTLIFKGQLPGTTEQVIVWDTVYVPRAINPRHFHPGTVVFRVLAGTGVWQEEGKAQMTLHAGDTLVAPAGTVHAHWNPSATETLRFLEFIVAPEAKIGAVPRQ